MMEFLNQRMSFDKEKKEYLELSKKNEEKRGQLFYLLLAKNKQDELINTFLLILIKSDSSN